MALVLVVATAAAIGVIDLSQAGAVQRLPRGALRIEISAVPASRPIPAGFLGFSIEYPSSLAYSGPDPAAPNPIFIRLVRSLDPSGGTVIRFGGDTTDWIWWPTSAVAKPAGIRYTLTRRWLAVTRATAAAIGARLILGINLEADSEAIARAEAEAFLTGIGPRLIAGFELGNEPEAYGALGWYRNAYGLEVPGRRRSYRFGSYLRDYAAISSALPRGVPLVGPASGASPWLARLNHYLIANPRVKLVTFHRYPLHRCLVPLGSPTYATLANMMSPQASSGPATSLQSAVEVTHARGLQFRTDELNSVSCGGARGISNTFASALWVLDTLFQMARVGVDGVNIHTFRQAGYRPFAFKHSRDGWNATVEPMYYGLLTFAEAAPAGSRILDISAPLIPSLRTWAARAPDGTVRVVLINDSSSRALTLAVRGPDGAGGATIERLTASGLGATGGVSFGGRTFGAATTTGELAGTQNTTRLQPIQRRYVVRLPAAGAALVTLR